MKFPNVNNKNFNFRSYLLIKYNGLFSETTPSKKEINQLKWAIKNERDPSKRHGLEQQCKARVNHFNWTWQEWKRQQ